MYENNEDILIDSVLFSIAISKSFVENLTKLGGTTALRGQGLRHPHPFS